MRVRRLGGDRAGEIRLTRLLRNDAVTVEEMVSEAAARTAQRCAVGHVLAIQDTTSIQSSGGGGLYLHAMIALDAEDGGLLGLVHGQFLAREGGRRGQRRDLPVQAKESWRWLQGAERAAQVCASAGRVTVIADRESDIFEAFAQRPAGVDLLVRAAQDRALEGEGAGRLFERAEALPVLGNATIELPAGPGRRARKASLAARVMPAELKRPQNGARPDAPASIALTLIDIREVDPPIGETPVHWRLLTTHAAANATEAFAVADLYRRRWTIEQLFRTLKTQGFDIEGLRIAEPQPRFKLVAAALVAAVVVQQMVHARDGAVDTARPRPVTDAFDPADLPLLEAFCAKLQGKTERQKNPHPKASLAYASWVCARLGGWTGYYGKPGPVVMLEGWLRFQDARNGVNALIGQLDV